MIKVMFKSNFSIFNFFKWFQRSNDVESIAMVSIYFIKPSTTILNEMYLDSLVLGRFQFNFREVIFELTLVNGGWGNSFEIVLRCDAASSNWW